MVSADGWIRHEMLGCRRLASTYVIIHDPLQAGDLNPYHNFLRAASVVVVTSDSVNMISEALSAPNVNSVYVWNLFATRSVRVSAFVDGLRRDGRVSLLSDGQRDARSRKLPALNELDRCVAHILERMRERL